MEGINQVKAAIDALSSPADTQRANSWLVDFEKSTTAWETSVMLLKEGSSTQYRFFGAKFLYSKLQRQFVQLNEQSANALKDELIQNLLQFSTENPIPHNVCKYLCLSLAALAVQLDQAGLVSQMLAWLNPLVNSCPGIIITLLTVLPEEADNRQLSISYKRRDAFLAELENSANNVAEFLSMYWPKVAYKDKCSILKCLENWLDLVNINPACLIQYNLLEYGLQALNGDDGELFDNASDFMVMAMRRFQQKDSKVLANIFPHILQLRNKWAILMKSLADSIKDDDDELDESDRNTAISLCRLFTETAESCFPVFSNLEQNFGQDELIVQLLECVKFKYDFSVAKIPLKFFYDLSVTLLVRDADRQDDEYDNHQRSNSPNLQHIEKLNSKYEGIYHTLLNIAIDTMQLTHKVLIQQGAIPESYSNTRMEMTETVLDCFYVLGPMRAMPQLCKMLEQEAQNGHTSMNWAKIESVLLAIGAIAPLMVVEMEQYVQSLLQFALSMPTDVYQLQITILILLGNLSLCLQSHGSYCGLMIDRLFKEISNPKTSVVASRSILNIIKANSKFANSLPVGELYQQLLPLQTSGTLPTEADLALVEAFAFALSHYENVNQADETFQSIIASLINMLSQVVANNKGDTALIVQIIDRIATFFKNYTREDSRVYLNVYLEVLNVSRVLLQQVKSETVCEKVCRWYRFGMRGCGLQFGPYLSTLSALIVEKFEECPVSAFLYAASTMVTTFALAENGKYVPIVYQTLWSMSSSFFKKFPTLEHFQQKPDTVEEYYYLIGKVLQYCPGAFIESEIEAQTIIQAALSGLAIHHREAQKGILLFFERFVQLSSFWAENSPQRMIARAKIQQYGGQLMVGLFTLLSGSLPAYALDESNGCISDVLWELKRKFNPEFKAWLQEVINSLSDGAKGIAMKENLLDVLPNTKSLKEFGKTLSHFENTCRRLS